MPTEVNPNEFKVMYWKYTAKTNRQIWYIFKDYKSALRKLNVLADKGYYTELYLGNKLIDYRNL